MYSSLDNTLYPICFVLNWISDVFDLVKVILQSASSLHKSGNQ